MGNDSWVCVAVSQRISAVYGGEYVSSLDTLYEEYSNLQLLKDLKESYKGSGKT